MALCTASGHDTHLFAIASWATLQLTWTSILVIGQVWQIAKQMTTLEVSNLGRYGFMGGRGGSSLRDQSGAMAGMGGGAGAEVSLDPTGVDEPSGSDDSLPTPVTSGVTGEGTAGGIGGRGHGHSHMVLRKGGGPIAGAWEFLMQILGFDRFTKGKAASGLMRAGKDQNPFDAGLIGVRASIESALSLPVILLTIF